MFDVSDGDWSRIRVHQSQHSDRASSDTKHGRDPKCRGPVRRQVDATELAMLLWSEHAGGVKAYVVDVDSNHRMLVQYVSKCIFDVIHSDAISNIVAFSSHIPDSNKCRVGRPDCCP